LRVPAKSHFAILGLAILLLLPAILSEPMLRDSFWIDWVWSDQFTAELARAHLYPRWLPLANGGAGSPTFYFYPPLAFYLSGLLGLTGLPPHAAVIGCFAIGLVLSGYTMLAWLEGTSHPLLGALFFMAAPYHLLDFYGRGAQAEFLAIALIPLVALGLRRARDNRPVLLAIAYAALILTHLPLALLASLFLIAPYCIWRREVRPYVLPLALGIAIAAIYLVPALALNSYRHSELLSLDPQFQPRSWSLIFPKKGPVPGMRLVISTILLIALIPTTVLFAAGQRKVVAYVVVCGLIAAGVVPAIWGLPLLREVQFPFRMLPLIEFALATGIASAQLTPLMRLLAASYVLMLTPVFVLVHAQEEVPRIEDLIAFHPDVPENRLAKPLPWPKWPEQVGLVISLVGLAGAGAIALRRRRNQLSSLEPAGSLARRGTGGASRPRAGRGRRSA
jgi:MYXO-CTERM domain-containing protein